MTTQHGQPFNVAHEGAYVGVMGQQVDIDSATFTGDVQLTVTSDASPLVRLQAGIDNLEHGDPREARKLIWNVMISKHGDNKALFYWLIAMLSGRTVRQFSRQEISQLRHSRSWLVPTDGDAWADGVRVVYRLLDSTAEPDMRLLIKQVDALEATQRNLGSRGRRNSAGSWHFPRSPYAAGRGGGVSRVPGGRPSAWPLGSCRQGPRRLRGQGRPARAAAQRCRRQP